MRVGLLRTTQRWGLGGEPLPKLETERLPAVPQSKAIDGPDRETVSISSGPTKSTSPMPIESTPDPSRSGPILGS